MDISDIEKEAIEYAKELIDIYEHGIPITYMEEENEMLKILLNLIERQEKN